MVVPRSTGGVLAAACLLLLPLMACAPQEGEEDVEADTAADTMAIGMGAEEMAAADPFEGEHELPSGRSVQMQAGQYTVQSAGDSVLAEGTYETRGDTVILMESTGPCANMRGVYTFTVEGGEVATMNVVEDACETRRQDIMAGEDTASQQSM